MPPATPKPSGEWHAATSAQPRRIFVAGPAIAGENTRPPRTPPAAAIPAAPAVLRMARRDSALVGVTLVIAYSFRFKTTHWSCPTRRPALRHRSRQDSHVELS